MNTGYEPHPEGRTFTCLERVTDATGRLVWARTTWLLPVRNGRIDGERRCICIEVMP